MKIRSVIFSAVVLFAVLSLASCKKDDPAPTPVEAKVMNDLPADPATAFDPTTGAPIGYTNKFTFFSFANGIVDSPSGNNWDLAFRATTILVNGGTSGTGNGAAQIVNGVFDDIATAPDTGFKQDNDPGGLNPAPVPNLNLAIPTGSGNGWYTSTAASQTNPSVITATAGKVILVRTADGKFAKVEMLSYYKGAPVSPNPLRDAARYYTFRYIYQADGSKRLK